MPWGALQRDLEPSVQVSLLRDSHGPAFIACMAGSIKPSEMMQYISETPNSELQKMAKTGWNLRKKEPKVCPCHAHARMRTMGCKRALQPPEASAGQAHMRSETICLPLG
jgi:hypothetical protein